jgi:hypothetical protein
MGACFADRLLSMRSFGQFVTIVDPERPAVARPSVEPALKAAMASSAEVVAVLGGEGVGKTWIVARWWESSSDRPILIVGSARSAHRLDPGDPLRSIATLLALQDEGDVDASSARWLRRLERCPPAGQTNGDSASSCFSMA